MKKKLKVGESGTDTEARRLLSGVKDPTGLREFPSLAESVIKDVFFALKAFTVASASLPESLRPTYAARPLNSLINVAES